MKRLLKSALIMFGSLASVFAERAVDFNFGWKFMLGEAEGAHLASFDDADWRELRLPHDWSVEAPFDEELEGATGYLPGGIGWYRKTFENPLQGPHQMVYVYFDGVYNNTEVWLNGEKLGFHPYGYSPFYYDITPYLKPKGATNVLAVKVDRSRYVDSRWYTGSGIYRNVKLVISNRLRVPIWGTYVRTPVVSEEQAEVVLEARISNAYEQTREFELLTEIVDTQGVAIAEAREARSIGAGEELNTTQKFSVVAPELWDVDTPNLYNAVTRVLNSGKEVDRHVTPFGIRSIRFDPNEGFFLNGKNILIKGVCLHHDAGLVGAAVPDGVWRRRLEKLKEAGCNAIRSAHNPPSEAFLNLCDEMGLLVQNEFFDEWDNPKDKRLNQWQIIADDISRGYEAHFQEWAERDLKVTMLRDRNHPSIIQWSIGNEIEWTYPRYRHATGFFDMKWDGNYFWSEPPIPADEIRKRYLESEAGEYVLADTAMKLANWTREMDTTRPVTANCILPSASHVTGYTDALDVVGYSYRRVMYDYGHRLYPDKVIMGTENLGQWHEWKAVIERPFISGTFLWTGIDYMGEANEGWPRKGISSGLLDLAGFEKPSFHMYKSLWSDEPHVAMATQRLSDSLYQIDGQSGELVEKEPGRWQRALWSWHNVNEHWNYKPGEQVVVEVYSNCEEVELFLDGKSLGIKQLTSFEDHIYKWSVPFREGVLVAKGMRRGQMAEARLATASEATAIKLSVDRGRLENNGYDVVHVVAQLIDEQNNPVRHEDREIVFSVSEGVRVLGVDNGAIDNVQDIQSDRLVTSKGRALLIAQSMREESVVEIVVDGEGLASDSGRVIVKSIP